MSTRLGILSVAYVNTGTYGAPAWDEVNLIGDMAVNPSWELAESTARLTRLQTQEPTKLILDVSGRIRVPKIPADDVGYDSFNESFLTNAILDMMLLNGPITETGSTGFRFDSRVTSFGEDQALANVLFKDFTLTPCASANQPQSVEIVAGAPVFTELGETGGS